MFLQVSAIYAPGSIPGSSTKKVKVRTISPGQFSFTSTSPVNLPVTDDVRAQLCDSGSCLTFRFRLLLYGSGTRFR